MQRFSQRESALLGYRPQTQKSLFMNDLDQYNNNPTSFPRRNSDIDFSDVFGGPPRRASFQETRYSFNESTTELRRASNDGQEDDDDGGGETERIGDRLTGLNEKPVFGDPEGGVNKRRYPREDFFDDIFKGKDYPLSSSPRKPERDSFSAAPGSRVLSPIRPLPPRAETFGGSSFPAHFSLPARLMKGTELPTFGSGNRNQHKSKDAGSNGAINYSYSPLSRFSSQANQVREAFENNVKIQSFLSKELSLSSEESLDLGKPADEEKSRNLEKRLFASDSDSPEVQDKSNQFHFSIYKWASKGAPLEMPLRGGKSLEVKSKFERSSSFNRWLNGEGMAKRSPKVTPRNQDSSSFTSSLSSSAARFMKELDKQKDGSFADTRAQGGVGKPHMVEEANLPVPDSESLSSHQVVVEDGLVNTASKHSKEETEAHSLSETALSERKVDRTSVVLQEATKAELKPLCSLFFNEDHEAVMDMVAKNDVSKESKVKSTKKSAAVFDVSEDVEKEADHSINVTSRDFDKANLSGSPKNLRSTIGRNKNGGKVKEFVKIFNQEASTKPKFDVESGRQSFRRKEMGIPYTTAAASVTSARIDEKLHSPIKNKTTDTSTLVDNLKKSEKQQPETMPSSTNSKNCTSGPKALPTSTVGSVANGLEATFGDSDESFYGNYLIEELPHDEEKPPQTGATREEFQVIDDKIRHWSRGKEGNIRSLLSTLQYILWPESGWKPVPLVDIIEGNAVRRSYQKALLCLHPDKLQQKGANSHQKYIAEKVFDILQEAWTHFSTLGSV